MSRHTMFAALGGAGALFGALISQAPNHANAQTELALPSMVVSATQIATPPAQIGSDVTVITAADIARNQWRALPDALRAVPGIQVEQAGGPGSATSVFIRGANANHTKVLLDGIDVTDPSSPNGAFDFSQVLIGDVARIEILRGPQSGLYGSDAIGGVILIETRKGSGPPHVTGTVEGGSFGTFNQSAGVSGGGEHYNYAVDVQHVHTGATPVTPLELLPPGRVRNDDRDDNLSFSTRLGADFSDMLGAGIVARYADSLLHFTGPDSLDFTTPAARQSTQSEHQFYTRGDVRLTLLEGQLDNHIGLAYTDDETRQFDPTASAIGDPAITSDIGHRLKEDWKAKYRLAPEETLLFGADAEQDEILASPVTAQNGDQGAFAEWQGRILDRLYGSASVRYDHNDRFGSVATWHAAPTYTVGDWGTQLKASAGTGFKAPTLNQLFVSFPAFDFFANPGLMPERSFGYDAGFEQPLANNRVRIGASYFHNDIRDLIDDNSSFTSLINIGHATTQGAETFATFAVTPRLDLRLDYTYTLAMNDETGQQLLRRPKHKVSLTTSWRPMERVTLAATAIYVGTREDVSYSGLSSEVAKPYYLVNLDGAYRLTPSVTLFARVENLLDQHYQDVVGFLRPGLGVFAGVRVSFDAKSLP
ncbi:MAG TPA: TonB-dependent receptor [Stellaceae bacterium]